MLKTVSKKILAFIVIIVGITFLSFLLSYLSPSDPATAMLSQLGTSPSEELLQQTREKMGLNKPFIVQYANWVSELIKFDMGTSYKTGKDVVQSFVETIPNTISLTLVSLFITIVISVPLGILCAKYPDGLLDNFVRAVTYFLASLPSFFGALMMLYVFCIKLGWFKVIAGEGFKGILMPACVLGFTLSAWYTRQVRGIALEQMNSEYVRGLKARGIPERVILGKHILKNCLLPIITLIGISFGNLLGGAAIVETIFSWNGVGKLAVEAVSYRDYPIIQGYAVWMAVIFLIINYIVEVLYQILDPRVRRGKDK